MDIDEIIIDEEFKQLAPPLSEGEKNELADSLRTVGQLQPVIVLMHNGTRILLDGHNRRDILLKLGSQGTSEIEVKEIELPNRDAAMDFILQNQLSRRNLKPKIAALIRGELYLRRRRNKAENLKQNQPTDNDVSPEGDGNPKGQSDPSGSTAGNIAKQFGVSEKTIKRDGDFAEAAQFLNITGDIISGKETRTRRTILEAAGKAENGNAKPPETLYGRLEKAWGRITKDIPASDQAAVRKWLVKTGKITPSDVLEVHSEQDDDIGPVPQSASAIKESEASAPDCDEEPEGDSDPAHSEQATETEQPLGNEKIPSIDEEEMRSLHLKPEKINDWMSFLSKLLRKCEKKSKLAKGEGPIVKEILVYFADANVALAGQSQPSEREPDSDEEDPF